LRLGGKILTHIRQEEPQKPPYLFYRWDKDIINILALGDSFTFGGSGRYDAAYPSQLAHLLARDYPGLTIVTNNGVCEYTSRDVLNNLSGAITLNHPDIILLLVGSANLFDPYPYAEDILPLYAQCDNFIRRLRTYKLFRYCYFETTSWLERNRMKPRVSPAMDQDAGVSTPDIDTNINLLRRRNRGQLEQMIELLTAKQTRQELSKADMFLLAGAHCVLKNRDQSLAGFERLTAAAANVTEQDDLMRKIAVFVTETPSMLAHDRIQNHLLAIKIGFPEDVRHVIAMLITQYSRNSELDPQQAVDAIDYLTAKHPRFYKNKRLTTARAVFCNMKIWRDQVGFWFENDMRKIIGRASEDGSRIVLQTYPLPYEPINAIVRRLARELKLPLADHERIFAPLIAKDRHLYIRDDNHCTDLGHEVMAKDIFLTLRSSFLSDPKELRSLQCHHGRYPQRAP
jgi:lysophospholipase L1-like esterase